MQVEVSLSHADWSELIAAAKGAEEAGYDAIAVPELAFEPFVRLALAGHATTRVRLASAIAVAFPRSPMVLAGMAWDIHAQTGGRFYLGLGTQVKGHNERRFSVPWSAPVPRLREYIEALRAIWRCWETGERLSYQGEHYRFTLMTPEFAMKPNGLPPIPVSIAAVGPAMLRLGGRLADGVRLHSFCTRKYIENVCMARIAEGLAQAGRARDSLQVHGGGFIATGPDEQTVQEKVEWIRYRVAFYGSTRTYWPVWEQHGLEDLGAKLHEMVAAGRWSEIAAEVSDDVVRLFSAIGTYDKIAAEIERAFPGTDSIRLEFPETASLGLKRDLLQDLARIQTPFKTYPTWP